MSLHLFTCQSPPDGCEHIAFELCLTPKPSVRTFGRRLQAAGLNGRRQIPETGDLYEESPEARVECAKTLRLDRMVERCPLGAKEMHFVLFRMGYRGFRAPQGTRFSSKYQVNNKEA
ncbi:hypothetical protein AVEN_30985-1 [Araneus ventricosus]|uniref:Uncharacterized protein n=1 Tax=Araneus ventricosus TaxID=182803 RepID=A0A4Y2VRL4_ARAVE|nr:hypothetical protein AVEN_30985-1 [Araneus ventricosus]